MQFSTIFFDLDDTLYPAKCGLWNAIRSRINLYMKERLNLSEDEIDFLRNEFLQKYGTTMRGLQVTKNIDKFEYLEYVHNVSLDQYISPDPEIIKMISELPQQKMVFTNADINHATRVLRTLNLQDYFSDIIDIHRQDPYCKPHPQTYQIALQSADERDPSRCIFVDDNIKNLAAAQKLGFYTIHIGSQPQSNSGFHINISNLIELPAVLKNL